HPQILYMMAASTSPYFGVSFENFWYDLRFPQNGGPVFFANWSADAAEFTRFDPDDPARRNMAPELWHEYAASAAAAPGLFASAWLRFGQTMQALVRNAAGLIVIVAFPFLMRGRNRALACSSQARSPPSWSQRRSASASTCRPSTWCFPSC